MSRSFTLVSGALKNVGDFLISEKCGEMVKTFLKPTDTLVLKRDADFKPYLHDINKTDAIIICGGPGYNTDFYGKIYPFLKLYSLIKVPIIPLGLGWRGFPLYHPERFRFSDKSKRAVREIHSKIANSSTRDELTRWILQQIGINNVINTGCPTLFDLKKMKDRTPFQLPSEIKHIAVSMAQQPINHQQNIELLTRLKKDFPTADVTAVFHRGLGTDKYTTPEEGVHLKKLVDNVKDGGFEIIDLAYDLERIKIYTEVDFHVGYRVHAHAYSVSQRKPSFLIWEDGRGQGLSENLQIQGVPARMSTVVDRLPGHFPTVKTYLVKGERRILGEPGPNPKALDEMMRIINNQVDSGFTTFEKTPHRLAELFSRLEEFFKTNETNLYS